MYLIILFLFHVHFNLISFILFSNTDNQFDIPDRTFHSMGTTWKLSSFISNTDVKELIPEFFFLQEFLQNGERKFVVKTFFSSLTVSLTT